MENEEYLTNIWSRIKGKGSCSIVLAEDQESVAVVTAILDSLKADLTEAHIVPVRICCGDYAAPLPLWQAIALGIWQTMQPVVDQTFREDGKVQADVRNMKNATRTMPVFNALVELLKKMKESQSCDVLLVLEDFEKMLAVQKEADTMKLRALSEHVILMVTSHKPLNELAKETYNNMYCVNKF